VIKNSLGVYGTTVRPGTVAVGDSVVLVGSGGAETRALSLLGEAVIRVPGV
jgi:hypothetical protein